MRKILILSIFFLLLCSSIVFAGNPKALIVIPQKFGANLHCTLEMLEQLSWDYTTSAISNSVLPCSGYASPLGCIAISVDTLLNEIDDISEYDAILIPAASKYSGVNPCYDLMNDNHFLNLLQNANVQNKIIWASCSAVRVLAAANILDGINIQGPDEAQYVAEFQAAGANFIGKNKPPVIDGNIITVTRGQFYMMQNIYAILTAMEMKD